MDYKDLFKRVMLLISAPGKAWEEISNEQDRKKVMTAFVYPLMGLCGLSVFLGTFIGNADGVSLFQVAMTRCCATFISLFGGYFLASYLTNLLGVKFFERDNELEMCGQFVGYSMVVTFVLDILSGLFAISLLHYIFQFYTLFVVYEGARTLMDVHDEKLTRYSLLATIIIILSPAVIGSIFNYLSVNLN